MMLQIKIKMTDNYIHLIVKVKSIQKCQQCQLCVIPDKSIVSQTASVSQTR